jgi:hypothetical protein
VAPPRSRRPRTRVTSPRPGAALTATSAPEVERHEISPTVLLTGVTVVVAILAAITLWAVFGRGDGDPVATPTRTLVSQTDDDPVAIAPVPTLSSRGTTGAVAFSWTYPGAEKGDTYRFRSAATLDGLGAATFVPLTTTTRLVTVAKGQAGLRPGPRHPGRVIVELVRAPVREGRPGMGVTVEFCGEISYGIGAHAQADAEISSDNIGVSVDLGATLGITR